MRNWINEIINTYGQDHSKIDIFAEWNILRRIRAVYILFYLNIVVDLSEDQVCDIGSLQGSIDNI